MTYELTELANQFPAEVRPELPTVPISARKAFLPCFEKVFAEGVPEGSRNQTLFRVAVMLIREGYNFLSFPLLCQANAKCSPPLAENELKSIFESASKENNGQPRYKSFGCEDVMRPLCSPDCPLKQKQVNKALAVVVPTLPTTISNNQIGYAELEAQIKKWLLMADPYFIKLITATVIANKMEGDPAWLLIQGSPGVGKTEVIQGLNKVLGVFPLSEITPNTFLSGEKSKHDPSLLYQIPNNAIFAFKDLGVIQSMRREDQAQILHQFREIYDGSFRKITGKGQETAGGNIKTWEGKVGFIAGATTAIERHFSVFSSLGERFLQYKIISPPREAVAKKRNANRGKEKQLRDEIKTAFALYLNNLAIPKEPLKLPDAFLDEIFFLADFVSIARSGIIRDTYSSREIELIPEPEMPTRICGQITMIASALMLINEGDMTTLDQALIRKLALDCIPTLRLKVISTLLNNDWNETASIADLIGYPTTTVRRTLEDLTALKLVCRDSEGTAHKWIISDKYKQKLINEGLSRNVPPEGI